MIHAQSSCLAHRHCHMRMVCRANLTSKTFCKNWTCNFSAHLNCKRYYCGQFWLMKKNACKPNAVVAASFQFTSARSVAKSSAQIYPSWDNTGQGLNPRAARRTTLSKACLARWKSLHLPVQWKAKQAAA
jgi:hypothetical protein